MLNFPTLYIYSYLSEKAYRDEVKPGRYFVIGVRDGDTDLNNLQRFSSIKSIERLGEFTNMRYATSPYEQSELDDHILQPAFVTIGD